MWTTDEACEDTIRKSWDDSTGFQRNQILMLKNNNDEWIEDRDDLNDLIRNHFASIYSSSGARDFDDVLSTVQCAVTDNMNLSLEAPVTDAEITRAVKQLGAYKAPGEDGYPGLFFHKYWSFVGDSVCNAVRQFFISGVMLPSLNKTLVVLIPKIASPEKIGHFRSLVKVLAPLGYGIAFFMVVIFFFKELGGRSQVGKIYLFGRKSGFHTRKTFTSVIHVVRF
ncbi:reverse transcriptase [Artemisia annua]|uniref:Reverse transcriptase n=1 Tax=Artemisia annua TaxID=35608 RepID=A0A2U1LUQ9_ARTAN|nr:reverse transcriptase [Artemisia annua]